MKKVVRAIDAGYGLTKFIQDIKKDGKMVCSHFPSMAVPSDRSTMSSLSLRKRNTVNVQVGNAYYEVGFDVLKAQTGNDVGREIGEGWSRSEKYRAIMLGALHYMNLEHIDILVLGLPINQYLSDDRRNKLAEEYTGTIDLPGDKKITIGEVVIRPQPFGGYIETGNHIDQINEVIRTLQNDNKSSNLAIRELKVPTDVVENNCVLVVDPGEYTMDWLLVEDGDINTKASGAASDSGRHRIVCDVQRAIEQDLGTPINPSTLPLINDALRTGEPLALGGRLIDLSRYSTVVDQSVSDPISRVIEGLRGLENRIKMIVVVGGHPEIYERALKARFPYTPVVVLKNSLYANVRGFQYLGDALAAELVEAE